MGTEEEIVFPLTIDPFLLDAGRPGITRSPGGIATFGKVEDGAFVLEVHEVGRREHIEAIPPPALVAVGGGIDVETSRLLREEHLGVGMEVGQYGVGTGVGRHLIRGLGVETRNLTDEGDGALREVLGTLWTDGGAWRQQELRVEGGEVGAWLYGNLDDGSGDRGQRLADGGMRHADDVGDERVADGIAGVPAVAGVHRAVEQVRGARDVVRVLDDEQVHVVRDEPLALAEAVGEEPGVGGRMRQDAAGAAEDRLDGRRAALVFVELVRRVRGAVHLVDEREVAVGFEAGDDAGAGGKGEEGKKECEFLHGVD